MSLRISVLGSGSSGNCTFVASSKTRLLIDGGLSRRQTQQRLSSVGESLDHIEAILVSHEHTDHISGLPNILARRNIPVFMSEGTSAALPSQFEIPKLEIIGAGRPFTVGDIQIAPFSVPHDVADPLGFNLEIEGIKIAHATDLGYLPEVVLHHLKGCGLIVLESNHDLDMLKAGTYPWPVKQRIMSRHGHLSNEMTGKFLSEDFDGQARYIVLAHLSQHNNHPDIARLVASQALESRGFDLNRLLLAKQDAPTPVIEI